MAGLILLLPFTTCAAGAAQTDYTFKGSLKQLRYCKFTGTGSQTVDFGEVGFRDTPTGTKNLDHQIEKNLTGTAMTCTGTGPVSLQFDVQPTDMEKAEGGSAKVFKTLTGTGKGIGIELSANGHPIDFDKKVDVTNPAIVPALTVKVVQMKTDGSDLVAGDFSAIATLKIIYS